MWTVCSEMFPTSGIERQQSYVGMLLELWSCRKLCAWCVHMALLYVLNATRSAGGLKLVQLYWSGLGLCRTTCWLLSFSCGCKFKVGKQLWTGNLREIARVVFWRHHWARVCDTKRFSERVELFPRILEEVCLIDWGHLWFCWKTEKWLNGVISLNKQSWGKKTTPPLSPSCQKQHCLL